MESIEYYISSRIGNPLKEVISADDYSDISARADACQGNQLSLRSLAEEVVSRYADASNSSLEPSIAQIYGSNHLDIPRPIKNKAQTVWFTSLDRLESEISSTMFSLEINLNEYNSALTITSLLVPTYFCTGSPGIVVYINGTKTRALVDGKGDRNGFLKCVIEGRGITITGGIHLLKVEIRDFFDTEIPANKPLIVTSADRIGDNKVRIATSPNISPLPPRVFNIEGMPIICTGSVAIAPPNTDLPKQGDLLWSASDQVHIMCEMND